MKLPACFHAASALFIAALLLLFSSCAVTEPPSLPSAVTTSTALTTFSTAALSSAYSPPAATTPFVPTPSSPISSTKATRTTLAIATPQSAASTTSRQVRITIPEGYTLSQIGTLMEKNGVCQKAALLATANSYDFTYYPLVNAIPENTGRCYRLEGYLFPDTYDFYRNMKPQDVLGKMLRGSRDKIGNRYSYPGMTTDELITLASLIEKEASRPADRRLVSSVFHNRLKATDRRWRLESDPTITYVEAYLKPNLTGDVNRYNAAYNTYKCYGLPAGPIGNPGTDALDAAASPTASAYFYFCANKKTGELYFAETLDEHTANLQKAGLVSATVPVTP